MAGKLPFLIAIILIGVAPMADTYVLIPAMTDIGQALPGVGLTKLNLILTISSLFVIPSSLIAGKLVESGRLSKKNCLLLGFFLFTLGGASGSLVVDINYLLFTRAVLGIGNGLATAMVVSVTADYFTDQQGATVMGLYSAISSLIAVGLTILSGFLVLVNWRYAFSIYLICILIMIYHGLVLKNNKMAETEEQVPAAEGLGALELCASRPSLGKAVWVLIAITFMSQILGNSLYLSLSLFIEGEKIGDSSATGLANGVLTVAIVVISLLFSPIYAKLRKNTTIIFFLFMAAGFFLLSRADSFSLALTALVIWGVGFGLTIPYVMQEAIVCPPRQLITFTGSLVTSCIFLSYVLSTFVHPLIASISGSEGVRNFFNIVSYLLLGCGLISLLLIRATRTHGVQALEDEAAA